MASDNGSACKVCGAVNPLGAKACKACGISLVAPPKKQSGEVDDLLKGLIESEQSRSKDEDNIDDLLDSLVLASEEAFDCPMCGKAVPPGSASCPSCGSEFVEHQIEPEQRGEDLFAKDLESELDKLSDALDETETAAPLPAPAIEAEAVEIPQAAEEPVAEPAAEPEPEVRPAPAPSRPGRASRAAAFGGDEEAVELDASEGDLPKVHIFGSKYVDIVVWGTIGAMVVAFVALGMYSWSNLNALSVGVLAGIAAGGMVASFMLFRISVSAVAEGDRLLKDGKFREALERYERAIHIDSRPSGAWTSKGVALKRLEMYGDALRAHNMALKLNPRNEIAHCNKGDLLFRVGKIDEALECYEAALKIRPTYAVAWNNKAIALARQGNLGEAKLCEDEAIRLRPKYATAWVNKGRILVQLGNRDEAVRCLQRARAISAKA
jgi:tetratricopeptide (TPR) repeat protein/ribosomal protein L40E